MPQIEFLIDAYIDANLLILFTYLVWLGLRWAGVGFGAGRDYRGQLRATEWAMLAIVVSPFLAPALIHLLTALVPGASLSAADFALAQFLNGRLQMDARQFETMLSLRGAVVGDVAALGSPFAWAVAGAFFVGLTLALAQLARNVFALRRLLSGAFVWRRIGRLVIRFSDETRVPFSTRGLFRRNIVLPTAMLAQPDQLRIALAHELQHIRRNDLEIEVALSLLQPFFFWNPAFALWRRDIAELRELACDQAVIGRNRVSSESYAECLLSACQSAERGRGRQGFAPAVPLLSFHAGRNRRNRAVLRRRICAICDGGGAGARAPMVSIGLGAVFVLAVILFASSLQRPGDWTQDRLMLSTIVNLERLELRNAGVGL